METTETTTMAPSLPKRPTFLTVICILTFIGSGYSAVKSVSTYFTAADAAAVKVSESIGREEDQINNNSNTPGFCTKYFLAAHLKCTGYQRANYQEILAQFIAWIFTHFKRRYY